jgi:hypothetical protein
VRWRRKERLEHRTGAKHDPPAAEIEASSAKLPTLAVTAVGELATPSERASLVSINVSVGGSAVTTWLEEGSLVVGIHVGTATAFRPVHLPELMFPVADLLPDDKLIVCGRRCYWRHETGADINAYVLGASDEVVTSGCLGDGIEHLAVDRRGEIWCGYFDEGIFGNYGWGGPGPEPIGSAGIVRFDDHLEVAWQFDPPGEFGTVADCYALNVDEDAWACYYTDFTIARIADSSTSVWRNGSGAPRALAVDGSRLSLFGGYRDARDQLVVGHLTEDNFERESTLRIVLPDGSELPDCRVVGRGPMLYFFVDRRWYQISATDIL